jgi:ribosomal protein S16
MIYFLKALRKRHGCKQSYRIVIVKGPTPLFGGFVVDTIGSFFFYRNNVSCLALNKKKFLFWLAKGAKNKVFSPKFLSLFTFF